MQGVEKYAVGVDGRHDLRQHLDIGLRFPACPRIPGIVVDEHADAPLVEGATELPQPSQTAGHVTVEIELIAVVKADPRIRVPQDDRVVSAELRFSFLQILCRGVSAAGRVVESLVAHHGKAATVARCRPCELLAPVQIVPVVQAMLHLLACRCEPLAPGVPLRSIRRRCHQRLDLHRRRRARVGADEHGCDDDSQEQYHQSEPQNTTVEHACYRGSLPLYAEPILRLTDA